MLMLMLGYLEDNIATKQRRTGQKRNLWSDASFYGWMNIKVRVSIAIIQRNIKLIHFNKIQLEAKAVSHFFISSFVRPLVHSSVGSFVRWFFRPLVLSSVGSFVCWFVCLLVRSSFGSFVCRTFYPKHQNETRQLLRLWYICRGGTLSNVSIGCLTIGDRYQPPRLTIACSMTMMTILAVLMRPATTKISRWYPPTLHLNST